MFDGKPMTVAFDNEGTWLETETEVCCKSMPDVVYKAIFIQFNGWEIDEVDWAETPDFKGYEIELEKEDTEVEVLVTEDDKLTIEEVVVEDDDDE